MPLRSFKSRKSRAATPNWSTPIYIIVSCPQTAIILFGNHSMKNNTFSVGSHCCHIQRTAARCVYADRYNSTYGWWGEVVGLSCCDRTDAVRDKFETHASAHTVATLWKSLTPNQFPPQLLPRKMWTRRNTNRAHTIVNVQLHLVSAKVPIYIYMKSCLVLLLIQHHIMYTS